MNSQQANDDIDAKRIPLGEYIFRRLQSLGINHIFGVPGDFNLNLLDHLDSVPGLCWVGTRNELNGAYAADGYARTRGLPGVVVTTYVVGELSAINGIGGAVAEGVPVIHIVGTTARAAQNARLMLHHTLGEGIDHAISADISKPLSAATAYLMDDANFTKEVDRVIEVCWKTKLPVYLYVPLDAADILIDAKRLDQPLDLTINNDGQEQSEEEVINTTIDAINKAQKPCLLVDLWTSRFGLVETVREILERTGLPAFVTPLAKSSIDETSENFGGLYQGVITPSKDVKDAIESSDLILHIGRFPSDTNQGGFSYDLKGTVLTLHPRYASFGKKKWEGLSFVPILKKLLERTRRNEVEQRKQWFHADRAVAQAPSQLEGPLKQRHIWHVFNSYLRDGDCVIAEVGSSQFGTLTMTLPANAQYYTQIFYSCIGFTVGSTLGTLIARREMNLKGRVILFVGDGSLQLTVQEISTIIHNGFTPTIIVVNNCGYTVERVIHGPSRRYNDIDPWNYQLMLEFFGAPKNAKSRIARTYQELYDALGDEDFQASGQIQVLEVVLDKYDSPWNLTAVVDRVIAGGAASMRKEDAEHGRRRKVLDGTLTASGLSTSDL